MSDHDMMPSSVRIDMAPSAFAILCAVFSKNERLNAILIQYTGSLICTQNPGHIFMN